MQQRNPLDIIDQELAKQRTVKSPGANKQMFLYLKAGHTALFRPLYELNKCLAMQKHDVYNESLQVASICATEIGQDCLYCFKAESEKNKRLTANYRIYLPIYVYKVVDENNEEVYQEEFDEYGTRTNKPLNGVRILELGSWGKIGYVLRFFRDYMKAAPITSADFSMFHVDPKSGGDKYFKMAERRKIAIDRRIAQITPQMETVREYVLSALPPSVFDDNQAMHYLNTQERIRDSQLETSDDDDLLPSNFTPF